MTTTATQQRWKLTVFIDSVNTGTWDKKSGGDVTAAETKYRPGGMAPEKSIGGPASVSNVTASREYILERDHAAAKRWLSRVGRARVTVHQHALDADGVPRGKPFTYRGVLQKVSIPDADSTATGVSMLEIEVSTDGTVD